ncbi:DUF523 domain-containing protein [Microbulbifer epialgicus]|uniref:DUF523 domain-containing protein n=1 Tax=Microbulbifer epialgicus TaxID=393907 RepID=A0ABV4P102_9GAMM
MVKVLVLKRGKERIHCARDRMRHGCRLRAYRDVFTASLECSVFFPSDPVVSSCLLGKGVRYNGSDVAVDNADFDWLVEAQNIITFCPEISAGLTIPRAPADVKYYSLSRGEKSIMVRLVVS